MHNSTLVGTARQFSKMVLPVYNSLVACESSLALHPCQHLVFSAFFHLNHSQGEGFLGHMLTLISILRNCQTFSKQLPAIKRLQVSLKLQQLRLALQLGFHKEYYHALIHEHVP